MLGTDKKYKLLGQKMTLNKRFSSSSSSSNPSSLAGAVLELTLAILPLTLPPPLTCPPPPLPPSVVLLLEFRRPLAGFVHIFSYFTTIVEYIFLNQSINLGYFILIPISLTGNSVFGMWLIPKGNFKKLP